MRLELRHPLAAEAAFVNTFKTRAEELATDLKVDEPVTELQAVAQATRAISVDGVDYPLLANPPAQAEDASVAAEMAAAALIRARWRLLCGGLADHGVPERPSLRQAAQLGLNLFQLIELHDAQGEEDMLLWACAERYRPTVAVLHGLDGPAEEVLASSLRPAAEAAADRLGFAVPVPKLERDASLPGARFRLRVRQLRGPVEPDAVVGDTDKVEAAVAAALVRAGPSLLDAAVLLARLLDATAVPPEFAREALRSAPILRVVEALRPLLADGFLLVDLARLCEGMIASGQPVDSLPPPGEGKRRLTLPGALDLVETPTDGADRLALLLRAALAPASLRVIANRGGDRSLISVITLAGATLGVLRGSDTPSMSWANLLGDAVAARATEAGDLVLVPQDVRRRVRDLLAERMPGLPVIGPGDSPGGIRFLPRGRPLRIQQEMLA